MSNASNIAPNAFDVSDTRRRSADSLDMGAQVGSFTLNTDKVTPGTGAVLNALVEPGTEAEAETTAEETSAEDTLPDLEETASDDASEGSDAGGLITADAEGDETGTAQTTDLFTAVDAGEDAREAAPVQLSLNTASSSSAMPALGGSASHAAPSSGPISGPISGVTAAAGDTADAGTTTTASGEGSGTSNIAPDTEASLSSASLSAPAAATSMNTIATYLNEYNTSSTANDFWDEFWGGGADTVTPHWNLTSSGTQAQGGTIYYNVAGNWYDADGLTDDGADATTKMNAIRHALNIYEDILGINFVETTVSSSATVDLAFGNETSGRAFANFSLGSGGEIYNAYVNIAENWSGVGNIGDYYFQTALHEIGHTLGLGHSGLYNAGSGTPTYNDAYWENDTIQFTMMSYWAQANYTAPGESTPSGAFLGSVDLISPMSVDWLALDRLYDGMGYGIDDGTTTGDTTWGFNSTWYDWTPTTSGPVEGYANTAYASLDTLLGSTAVTIVDGGGNDTLDLSGYANNTKISLEVTYGSDIAPAFSNVAGLIGNLAIAPGTVIENAIGGDGDEEIIGNSSANILEGGGGNDTIDGQSGNDTIDGGDGDDSLIGGYGVDSVSGGAGNDTIYPGNGGFNAGEVFNGGGGTDTLEMSSYNNDYDIDLAAGEIDTILGGYLSTVSGIENVNAGNGDDSIVGSSASNVLDGGSGSDTIFGGGNADTLIGGAGNDQLYGGFHTDSVSGGAGNDTIYALDGEYYDSVDGGTGTDTLDHSAATYSGTTFDFLTETITGTGLNGASATLVSIEIYQDGSGANTIIADNSGGEFYGNDGDDTIVAGLNAAETLDGGAGTDLLDTSTYDFSYVVNLATGLTDWTGESFVNFEDLITGDGNDTLTGTTGSNVIDGGAGNDSINGNGGDDTLIGNAGNDTLVGQGDGDSFDGGDGDDLIQINYVGDSTIAGGAGTDTVDILTYGVTSTLTNPRTLDVDQGYSIGGGAFQGTWSGIENILSWANVEVTMIGNGSDNLLQASSQNDTLLGESGNDTLLGLAGKDSIDGGAGDDTINGAGGRDTVDGGDGADSIVGGNGHDELHGGGADDTIKGGGGNDTVWGDNGRDVIYLNNGADLFNDNAQDGTY
ncbi:M10 family metallopeptidase C-terminal domain-containing protein, partial [Pseudooceanicola nanhaiensis]|uniref:M10 family metallopeptidase C-terminal domain-containing protein n=1 Tax=Pseudooceanicola nanhaiensis TaxID=375761 RepID=UPI001CD3A2D7